MRTEETADMRNTAPIAARMRRFLSPSRFFRGGRGQSLVEFAMVLPILTILIFGVIDFSLGLRSYISLTNATREGARYAAVGNAPGSFPTNCDGVSNTTTVGRVCVAMEGLDLDSIASLSVTYPNGQSPGNSVVVSAEYTHEFITPLADLASFFSGGSFPDTLSLDTSSDMRLE
jgi:Flp pilus assembly protein TadG